MYITLNMRYTHTHTHVFIYSSAVVPHGQLLYSGRVSVLFELSVRVYIYIHTLLCR